MIPGTYIESPDQKRRPRTIHPDRKISAYDLRVVFIRQALFWRAERRKPLARESWQWIDGRYVEALLAIEQVKELCRRTW